MNKDSAEPNIAPTTIRSYEHLGNAIRRVRKLLKLSQGALATKTGLTQATISNIERGKTSAEINTLLSILSVLNLDIILAPRAKAKNDDRASLEGLF